MAMHDWNGNGPGCLGAIISAGLGFFLTAWISFKLLGNSDGTTVLGMILWLPCSILAYIWLRKINFF